MKNLFINASQIDKLDIGRFGKLLSLNPNPQPISGIKKSLIKSAVGANNKLASQAFDVADDKTQLTFLAPRKTPVGVSGNANPKFFTLAVGLTGGHAMVLGPVVGAGVYGSNNGEIGVYGSGGFQIISNVGVSGGIETTFIFGPPSDFKGTSIGIGVDVGPNVGYISGMLLFTPSPMRFLGFTIGFGAGLSILPANITIQVSNTSTKPVFTF